MSSRILLVWIAVLALSSMILLASSADDDGLPSRGRCDFSIPGPVEDKCCKTYCNFVRKECRDACETTGAFITTGPTSAPTKTPSVLPTISPTDVPTDVPSDAPTDAPSDAPSSGPTVAPSPLPTRSPTTNSPTGGPTPFNNIFFGGRTVLLNEATIVSGELPLSFSVAGVNTGLSCPSDVSLGCACVFATSQPFNRYDVVQPGVLAIETSPVPGGVPDTILHVWHFRAGVLLNCGFNDDFGGLGLFSRLAGIQVSVGDEIYIIVSAFGAVGDGRATVTISEVSSPAGSGSVSAPAKGGNSPFDDDGTCDFSQIGQVPIGCCGKYCKARRDICVGACGEGGVVIGNP